MSYSSTEQTPNAFTQPLDNYSGNAAIIKKLYSLFAVGRHDELHELFDAEAVWMQMDGFPGGGVYKGSAAIIRDVFGRLKGDWLDWKAVVSDTIGAGDHVFVSGYYEGTHCSTGKYFNADFMHHYQFKDGKISSFKQYTDTARIVAASLV